jgi:hypothetical protein
VGEPWVRCGWCDRRVYMSRYGEIITRPYPDSPSPHPGRIPACESCCAAWDELRPSAGPNEVSGDKCVRNRLPKWWMKRPSA